MTGTHFKASTVRARSYARSLSTAVAAGSAGRETIRLTLLAALALALQGCTALSVGVSDPVPLSKFLQVSQAYTVQDYRVVPGDQLTTRCYYNPQLDEEVLVRPDGNISLSLVGEIRAAGKTAAQLSDEITKRYAEYFVKPTAIVIVRQFNGYRVFTAGELRQPGRIDLLTGAQTVLEAISTSGGVTADGTLTSIILIRRLPNQAQPMVAELDISEALSGDDPAQNVALMPNDFIYVPRSGMADFNYALQQYVFNTLNLSANAGISATYELNSAIDGNP